MRLVLRTLADVAEEIAEEIALGTVDRDERIVVEEYETHFDWFPVSVHMPHVRAVYGFGAGYLADWLGRKNAEKPTLEELAQRVRDIANVNDGAAERHAKLVAETYGNAETPEALTPGVSQ